MGFNSNNKTIPNRIEKKKLIKKPIIIHMLIVDGLKLLAKSHNNISPNNSCDNMKYTDQHYHDNDGNDNV